MKGKRFDIYQCSYCENPYGVLTGEVPKRCPYCEAAAVVDQIDENVEFKLLVH